MMLKIFSIFSFFWIGSCTDIWTNDNWVDVFNAGTTQKPEILEEFFTRVGAPKGGRHLAKILTDEKIDYCGLCQTAVPIAKLVLATVNGYEDLRDEIITACKLIVLAVDNTTDVDIMCPGLMDLQAPHVISILKKFSATTAKVCRNLNLCFQPESEKKLSIKHQIKAPLVKTKQNRKDTEDGIIRIVHFADIHVDPLYAIGSPTDCGLPVCCRNTYTGEGSAQTYGSYGCNTPQRTLEHFLSHVKTLDPQPDFVIYTGDNPGHHMWYETEEFQTNCSQLVIDSFSKVLSDYKVYTVVGNHEMYPTNLFYLPKDQDLLENLVDWWGPLADMDNAQLDTIRKAAYYTMSTPIPGLRLLSVNTNFWYAFNFYNILNEGSTEVKEMQKFIIDTLTKARLDKEKVIMLLHHPVGNDDVIHTHSRWYQDIVHQFSDVITFQLAGHTHHDEFKLFSNPLDGKAESVLLVGPSVTMRSSHGVITPSMRVLHVDRSTKQLMDYEQYRMNLTPDIKVAPKIELIYKASEAFGMKDLTPESYRDFVDRLETDTGLFEKWFLQRITGAPGHIDCSSDPECRHEQICALQSTSFDDFVSCKADKPLTQK